jgi:uncharacterized protein YneF (UPF0154 family)
MKLSKKILVALIVLIAVIGLTVGGFFVFRNKDSSVLNNAPIINDADEQVVVTTSANPFSSITSSTVIGSKSDEIGLLIFADETLGFGFKYPDNWKLEKYVDENYDSRVLDNQKAYSLWLFDSEGERVGIIFTEGQYGRGWDGSDPVIRRNIITSLGIVNILDSKDKISYNFANFPNSNNNLRLESSVGSSEIRTILEKIVNSFEHSEIEYTTFRDKKLGFELKFPADYATQTYRSEHLFSEGGPAGDYFAVRLGLNKYHDPYWLSVYIIDIASSTTTAMQYFGVAHAGDRVQVSETQEVKIGPDKEKFIEIKDKTFFRSFITIKNGVYYEIYVHDSGVESVNNLAQEVLNTFRFIN